MTETSCQFIEVIAPRDTEDRLVPIWWQSGYAGLVEDTAGDRVCWKIFFDANVSPESLQECATRCMAVAPEVTATVQTQPLHDWLSQWKTFFTPVEISPQLVITTEGIPHTPKPGQTPIVIVAGMAFGTGQHPTTQLIAHAIATDSPTHQWDRMLDMGTGTGILGLVGLACGVTHVDGVDIDADALVCAKENIVKNKRDRQFTLSTTLDSTITPYPVIVANILLDPLVAMAQRLTAILAKGGDLYMSGVLIDQAPTLQAAYEKMGLSHVTTATQGEWAMVQMRKG